MLKHTIYLILAALALACAEPERLVHATSAALTYTVTSSADSNDVDGVCTLREAWRAAVTNAAVDTCPAGSSSVRDVIELPAQWDMALAGLDNTSMAGDLDAIGAITLRCPTGTACVLDAHGIDRLLHAQGTSSIAVEGDVTLRGGCANGGTCNAQHASSVPSGGAIYHNSTGELVLDQGVRITGNTAMNGGGLALCAPPGATVPVTIDGVTIDGNTATSAGGAVDAHIALVATGLVLTGNAAPWGGAWSQYAAEAVLYDAEITGNTASPGGGGGVLARGQPSGTTSGAVTLVGGTVAGNTAAGQGADVYAGRRGTWEPCASGTPCRVTLDHVTGPTITAEGVGGLVEVITGPTCGDGVVEPGEQCEPSLGPCCTPSCTWAAPGTPCDDGDACTPADTCDGAGACQAGGTTCGDGIIQPECGETVAEVCGG